MTKPYEIVVNHNPIIKPIELEELRVALSRITPNINVQEKTFGMQNNIEWFYPAAIAIFITSDLLMDFCRKSGQIVTSP